MNTPIRKVGIVLRPSSPQLRDTFMRVRDELEKSGIEVMIESNSSGMIGLIGSEFASIIKQCDALMSLGGDGTLISLLRRAYPHHIPSLGVNTGKLGFLTAFMPEYLPRFTDKLKNGEYDIKKHLILQAHIESANGESKTAIAVNEFLISKHDLSGIVSIDAQINHTHFNTYTCDGLIIGTPTGSTAYNISAGGSVIYPYCRNILITPIAPHSLTQRPLVLSDEFELTFSTKEEAKFIIDGQEMIDIMPSDCVKIRALDEGALIIYPQERDYFAILQEKFKWGEKHG